MVNTARAGVDGCGSGAVGGTHPAQREVDVVLHSGATIRLRPVVAQDEQALRAFLTGLSPESRAFRFFTAAADLGAGGTQCR